MGVSLETGQCKFASIIQELSRVPSTLSQFFVWVDLCVAEYKTKGSVSQNCSGGKPDPDWLHGLKDLLEGTPALAHSSGSISKARQGELQTVCPRDGLYNQEQATLPNKGNIYVQELSPVNKIQNKPTTVQYIYVQPKMPLYVIAKNKQKPLATNSANTNQIATQKENAGLLETDINANTNLLSNSTGVMSLQGKMNAGTENQSAVKNSPEESKNSVVPVSLCISSQPSVNSADKIASVLQNSSPKTLNKCSQNPAASSRTKRKSVLISNFLETAKLQNTTIKTEVVSDDEENNSGLGLVDIVGDCSNHDDMPLVITDIRTETEALMSASRIKHNYDTQDCMMIDVKPTLKTEPVSSGWQGKHNRVRSKDYVPGPVKKARTNVGNMQMWLRDVYGEERQIEDMPPEELDKYLSEFLMDCRKRNGEDYDPNSFKDIRGSFERHLHDRGYPYSIIKSGIFAKTQKAYLQKRDILRNVLQYKMLNNPNRHSWQL